MVSSLGYSQDSLKCFNQQEQKQILEKFIQLDECNELRHQDSVHLFDLRTINSDLGQENTDLKLKAVRRKKVTIIGTILSFAGGVYLGIKL